MAITFTSGFSIGVNSANTTTMRSLLSTVGQSDYDSTSVGNFFRVH